MPALPDAPAHPDSKDANASAGAPAERLLLMTPAGDVDDSVGVRVGCLLVMLPAADVSAATDSSVSLGTRLHIKAAEHRYTCLVFMPALRQGLTRPARYVRVITHERLT